MKYIRHKKLGFIIFQPKISHETFSSYFGGKENLISAGFISIEDGVVKCFGKSNTLGIVSKEKDSLDILDYI